MILENKATIPQRK